MNKPLTKNARWIVLLFKTEGGGELLLNLGRWSYDVPEQEAIFKSVTDPNYGVSRHVYLVDVDTGLRYSKQWKKVSALAKTYFLRRGLCREDLLL